MCIVIYPHKHRARTEHRCSKIVDHSLCIAYSGYVPTIVSVLLPGLSQAVSIPRGRDNLLIRCGWVNWYPHQ